jgi:hypothetical protein
MTWPPNVMLTGDSVAIGAVPVPVSGMLCGLPEALSVTVIKPGRDPVAVGVKVTLIEQLVPAARVVPQLFVWTNSPPLLAMPAMAIASLPVFESVMI